MSYKVQWIPNTYKSLFRIFLFFFGCKVDLNLDESLFVLSCEYFSIGCKYRVEVKAAAAFILAQAVASQSISSTGVSV